MSSSPPPTGVSAGNSNGDFPQDVADDSLTVLVTHHVRRDKHEAFKKWSQDTNVLVRSFAGFVNAEVIRPAASVATAYPKAGGQHIESSVPEGYDEFIAIVRFDNFAHLNAWMKSPERQTMMDRVTEYADEAPNYSFHSLEHWFVTADDVAATRNGPAGAGTGQGPPPLRPPAKWKMFLVTVAVIYTQALWIPKVARKVLRKPIREGKIDRYLLEFINVVLIVTMATFVLFPVVTRLLSFWLTPGVNYRNKLMELVPSKFQRQQPLSKSQAKVVEKENV